MLAICNVEVADKKQNVMQILLSKAGDTKSVFSEIHRYLPEHLIKRLDVRLRRTWIH